MSQAQVPLIVVTERQDDVEIINRILRDAGHPVHCRWVKDMDSLAETLTAHRAELLWVFTDDIPGDVAAANKIRKSAAPMVPLLAVSKHADENAIADAMKAGAQDLLTPTNTERLRAVAERELRALRLERALNETLVSAHQYKKELKAFMAGSVDAIAYVQEGIIVDANQAWAELFEQENVQPMQGHPLMDFFDVSGQAALKGALVACAKGQWDGDALRVAAISKDGSTVPLKLSIEASELGGEPAIKLSVPREQPERKEPDELVEDVVHKDPITGFYHRRRFVELLTDRLDANPRGGVRVLAYLRPDKFGEIKDEVGPLASEDILVQLAEVIQGLAQPNDLCGRFAGVVFTILLERGALRDAEAWAENLITTISDHIFEVAHNTLSITCTIGLAEVVPGADRVESLISDAEQANKRGRKRGGNQVVLAEISDESTRIKRFDEIWVRQVKAALMDNRFRLVHLPIASLSGEHTKLYDTVLRMVDEQGDEVLATEFMPAAERNRLLKTIDRWVIGASLSFCRTHGVDQVFIKLSRESITDPTLLEWIGQQVNEIDVKPAQICFQVSEEDITQFLRQTKVLVEKLSGLGFSFAVEHFGVGRDPMKVLEHTPMDYLKIDGSLMQGIAANQGQQETVRAFVRAANERKIATIAERVEDANTMAVLFQLGIGYMQGHYLHEPEVVLEAAD